MTVKPSLDYAAYLRDVPDFPKPGIVFKDITPLLLNPAAFNAAVDDLCGFAREMGSTHIAGIESRGFLFGAAMAARLDQGFIAVRKPGKLPWKTFSESYDLEYGQDTLEIHQDAAAPGDRVLLVDDLLATGGTAEASVKLVRHTGAEVIGCVFAVELTFLGGRERLHGLPIEALTDGERSA